MMVCLGIQKKGTRLLRSGVYLFTIMEWVSAVGFGMFPLSDSGYAGTFQDQMHILSTVIVVLLSIISLHKKRKYSVLKYGLLTVVASVALLGSIYSYFGGLGTGKCADINEFEKYAVTVEDISIPEQAKIVALGEATHGNQEFQQLFVLGAGTSSKVDL